MTPPTIHIIDDDSRIRRAVSRLLRSYQYTVQCYSSAVEFLSQKVAPGPACIVLDLKMPKITGLDLQEMLSHRDEHLQIIFLTGQADIETSVRAMKAGAVDFLTKPFDDHQFLSAIRNALALSEQTLAKQDEIKRDREAFVSLSPREREVCIRIAEGFLNKQVGFELGTSEKTIKAQRASVMQKLGARSLPDVVRLVERLRIAGTFPAASNPPRT